MPPKGKTRGKKSPPALKRRITRSTSQSAMDADQTEQNVTQPNAYERILKKVQDKRKAEGRSSVFNTPTKRQKAVKLAKPNNNPVSTEAGQPVQVNFTDDDTYFTMEVQGVANEFPNPNEDDPDSDMEIQFSQNSDNLNSNAAQIHTNEFENQQSALGSRSVSHSNVDQPVYRDSSEPTPGCSYSQDDMQSSFEVMQSFMVEKGFIKPGMTPNQIGNAIRNYKENSMNKSAKEKLAKAKKPTVSNKGRSEFNPVPSESEATIYKRAVKQVAPGLDDQIENYLSKVRRQEQERGTYQHHQKTWTLVTKQWKSLN